jgi:hypothetical protein
MYAKVGTPNYAGAVIERAAVLDLGRSERLLEDQPAKRKRIEECFGWLKMIAILRKVGHHGTLKVDRMVTFACVVLTNSYTCET